MSSMNQKRLSQNVYPQAALRFLHCILANVILVRIMFNDKEQIKITIPNNSIKKYVKMQNKFKEICLNIKLFDDKRRNISEKKLLYFNEATKAAALRKLCESMGFL